MTPATFFVSCKHHRQCAALLEVATKAEQRRLQHVWACDRCAQGLTPTGQRSPLQRKYRAERRRAAQVQRLHALVAAAAPTPPALDPAVVDVLDAYAKGREEGFRAGYNARSAEIGQVVAA